MATAHNELTDHAEKESGTYKPSEHDGLKKDGTPDARVKSDHGEFSSSQSFLFLRNLGGL